MEQGFLDALRDAPDDRTNHLVYADWLDDEGRGGRADFIRAWWAAEALPPARREEERAALRGRYQVEFPAWLGPAAPAQFSFTGAVVESLAFNAYPSMAVVAGVLGRNAVKELTLPRTPTAAELEALPGFACLRGLQVRGDGGRLEEFFQGRAAPSLRRLKITGGLTNYIARSLAWMPRLASVRSLRLAEHHLDDSGIVALARSPFLHGLTEWHAAGRFTSLSLLPLFKGRRAARWRALTYGPGSGRVADLTGLVRCENLERLALAVPRAAGDEEPLACLGGMPRLRELTLTGDVGERVLGWLAAWPGLARLDRLAVQSRWSLPPEAFQPLVLSAYRNPRTEFDMPGGGTP